MSGKRRLGGAVNYQAKRMLRLVKLGAPRQPKIRKQVLFDAGPAVVVRNKHADVLR